MAFPASYEVATYSLKYILQFNGVCRVLSGIHSHASLFRLATSFVTLHKQLRCHQSPMHSCLYTRAFLKLELSCAIAVWSLEILAQWLTCWFLWWNYLKNFTNRPQAMCFKQNNYYACVKALCHILPMKLVHSSLCFVIARSFIG